MSFLRYRDNDDDEDYMSNEILSKCKDERPGLIKSRDRARLVESEKRHQRLNVQNRTPSTRKLEADRRQEGLSISSMTPGNKGLALMQKMGYKPGMSIGKKEDGRAEPVAIHFKAGRSGLGHDTEVQRKRTVATHQQNVRAAKRQFIEKRLHNDFRSRLTKSNEERKADKHLYMSQRVCEQLDSQNGIPEPSEVFFWPPQMMQKKEEEGGESDGDESSEEEEEEEKEEEQDEDVEFSAADKLEILTLYLRNKYHYCVWCGTSYNDRSDMKDNCPGSTAADHDDM